MGRYLEVVCGRVNMEAHTGLLHCAKELPRRGGEERQSQGDQLSLFAWDIGCRSFSAKTGTVRGKVEWLVILSPAPTPTGGSLSLGLKGQGVPDFFPNLA